MKDYLVVISGKAVSAVCQMAMLLLLATSVEERMFGLVLATYSIAAIIASLGDLGLATLSMRSFSDAEYNASDMALKTAEVVGTIVLIVSTALMAGLSFVHRDLLFALPLFAWASLERMTENRLLRRIAQGNVGEAALATGLRRVLAVALFVIFWKEFATEYIFSWSLFGSAAIFYAISVRRTPLDRDSSRFSFSAIRDTMPIMGTTISGQLRNMDVPIVASLIGGAASASYGFGARMAAPILLIYSSVSGLILIRVRQFTERRFKMLLSALVAVPVCATVGLIPFAGVLSSLISPFIAWFDIYSAQVAFTVMNSYLFAGSSIILGSICIAYRMDYFLMKANVFTATILLGAIVTSAILTQSVLTVAVISLFAYAVQLIVLTIASAIGRRKTSEVSS